MLKVFLDSLDGVEDSFKDLYKETETGFVLDAESSNGYEIANTAGLKSALEKERSERSKLRKKLDKLADIDPDEYQKALERAKSAKEPDEAAQSKLAEQKKLFESEMQKVQSERDKVIKQLERSTIYATAAEELQKKGGNATLLMPHILNQTKMVQDESGNYKAVVIDPVTGNPKIGDNAGNDMTVAQLVEKMYNDETFSGAFSGNGNSGTGATRSSSSAQASKNLKVLSPSRFEALGPAERMEFIRSGGAIKANE